jgi:hypothetical protein
VGCYARSLTPTEQSEIDRHNSALEEIANQLENMDGELQFKVARLPVILKFEGWGTRREETIKSYCNGQVEYYEEFNNWTKNAYLPMYDGRYDGTEDLIKYGWVTDKIKSTLHECGFGSPTFVDAAFDQVAYGRGGLHCISKVLRREAT